MNEHKKRGGARPGAGRKPKADEARLIEKLSPLENKAHEVLKAAIKDGEQWAIKMYFEYMYGKPRQQTDIDLTTNGESVNVKPKEWTK